MKSSTVLKIVGGTFVLAGAGVTGAILYRMYVTTKVPPLPTRKAVVQDKATRELLDTSTAKASADQNAAALAETRVGRPLLAKKSALSDL